MFVVKQNMVFFATEPGDVSVCHIPTTLLYQHLQGVPALTGGLCFPSQPHEQREKQHRQGPEHRPGER